LELSQFNPRLAALGWDADFEARFGRLEVEACAPARVIADFGAEYLVHDGGRSRRATAGRRLREGGQPAVGDWVAVASGGALDVIHAVAERRTQFSRRAASVVTKEQILAANVDLAFVVAAATDVNQRRIERYLTIAWQSGATPVVILTKADLSDSPDTLRADLEATSSGTPVVVTSSVSGEGMEAVTNLLRPARTGVLLGPSGVGKSTLINRMAGGELMRTREIHRSGEGRHMTSHRQLIQLEGGGMIIDTPGLREAQLWEGEEALTGVFDDIESLVLLCRFPDCEHRTEPGCAVKAAIAEGRLDSGRFQSYRKLQRELRAVAARSDARLRADERRKWKHIATANKARSRYLRG
jgi:ribosome biogenesis GTPase